MKKKTSLKAENIQFKSNKKFILNKSLLTLLEVSSYL